MPTIDEIQALVYGAIAGKEAKKARFDVPQVGRSDDDDDNDTDAESNDDGDDAPPSDPDADVDDKKAKTPGSAKKRKQKRAAEEFAPDNLRRLLLEFAKDRERGREPLRAVLEQVFNEYSLDVRGTKVEYGKGKFWSKMAFTLRRIGDFEDQEQFALLFMPATGEIKLTNEATFSFAPLVDRLRTDDAVLLYTTRDLACLFATLRLFTSTLSGEFGKSKPDEVLRVSAAVETLSHIVDDSKLLLKKLDGSEAALKEAKFLLNGEPLFTRAVALRAKLEAAERSGSVDHPVSIYFDFAVGELLAITADDIDVPTAGQLDQAYDTMSRDVDRVMLLDLRAAFKRRRGWK